LFQLGKDVNGHVLDDGSNGHGEDCKNRDHGEGATEGAKIVLMWAYGGVRSRRRGCSLECHI